MNKISYFLIKNLKILNSVIFSVALYPLMRDIVAMGIGSATVTLSMSTSLLLIGGAWCFYRPGLALFILLVAAMPFLRGAMKYGQPARPNSSFRSSRTSNYSRMQT